MAIHPNRNALAALGLMRKLNGKLFGDKDKSESDVMEDNGAGGLDFNNCVEAGEDLIDEFLGNLKKSRERFHEQIKEGAARFLSDLGLVTRRDLEQMKEEISSAPHDKED